MGIQDILTTKGSAYTKYDGATPSVNPLATQASKLHADLAGTAGYSLDGASMSTVNTAFNQYDDGMNNVLPQPSQLDMNGKTPAKYKNPEKGTTYP
jgi:hypothetical protein